MAHLWEPVVDPARLAGPQPELAAAGLVLRRWVPKDAEQLVAALTDPDIRHWNLRTIDSLDEAVGLISTWRRDWRRRTAASWAVVRPGARRRVLGQVGFRSLYLTDGMAEISYWVAPEGRRQGLASSAARILSDWAFTDLGFERLELVHSVRNLPSCGVAVAAGFEFEGTKRRLQRHADGWHDMHLHARIRPVEEPARDGLPAWFPPLARPGGRRDRPAVHRHTRTSPRAVAE
jgi:[ribosomal protein S5]-alanine N-acetyltransferase